MTADITIITAAKEDVVVPVSATNFTPTSDLFKALGRPTGKPNGQPGQAPAAGGNDNADSNSSSSSDADASTSTAKSNSKNKTVWVKNGNNIQPRNVTVGLGDGINYTVKSGLAIGDTVILSATVGKKEEKPLRAANPFMPTPQERIIRAANDGNHQNRGPETRLSGGNRDRTRPARVSFEIQPHEFVAIMGTSGSGKSTMLNILGCLDKPSAGHYYIDGIDMTNAARTSCQPSVTTR